ncbi:phosphotransferase family protein [Sediminibacillus halophilus]|uniref:Fructokinase n=1 Tax=Sediminibacillus halophilus TaxID=482461 RepID=A0A1G9NK53_9BACI|nr:aminoglycoside phosphotransferase family protein [Sediminibacillus halophilus]SDL86365.1 fructokinase [Sediminibacillus halophilus]
MKAGWERSTPLIVPSLETIRQLSIPILNDRELTDITPLNGGLSNSNLKITTDSGERFVLRIYSKDNTSIEMERNILNMLEDRIHVPKVLYSDSSCAKLQYPFLVLSWMEGVRFSDFMQNGQKQEIVSLAGEVGETLAKIHQIHFPDGGFFDASLNIDETVKLDRSSFLEFIEGSLVAGHGCKHLGKKTCEEILTFAREHASVLDWLGEQDCLVHSDFNPLNILVDTREKGYTISAVLDWEYAFSGSPLFDIGNMLRYESVEDSDFIPPFISAYQKKGGILPKKWLQQAKLLDLIALCELTNKEVCGKAKLKDIKRLILKMTVDWEKYEAVQASYV